MFPGQYWNFHTEKGGYSGVAILSKYKPISVQTGLGDEDLDKQGRCITLEFPDFYVVSTYVMNAGQGLKNLDDRINKWDVAFKKYVGNLKEKKTTVILGDLNVAHKEIDIANPKINKKSAGFTIEERNNFSNVRIFGK